MSPLFGPRVRSKCNYLKGDTQAVDIGDEFGLLRVVGTQRNVDRNRLVCGLPVNE